MLELWTELSLSRTQFVESFIVQVVNTLSSNGLQSGTRQETEYSGTDYEFLESSNLKKIPFSELKEATNNFYHDSIVFQGSSSKVYKGQIVNRSIIASIPELAKVILVKQFLADSHMITRQESLTGIKHMLRLEHPNLVKLVGYCLDKSQLLIAFEFMAQGSLREHLFARKSSIQPLSWKNRIKIALDVAKVVAFFHSDHVNLILRDLHTSTILLDENYNAKLYDFDLATSGPVGDDEDHVSTTIMGTMGYLAPEYAIKGHLSTKCDVYAFGAILIEMLTSRRIGELMFSTDESSSADWEIRFVENKGKLATMMDVEIEGQYSIDEAQKVANLGVQCLSADPSDRPNMSQVVGALEQLVAEMETPLE